MYQLAQRAGVANLQDEDGNLADMSARDALFAMDMGIKGEREILGDTDSEGLVIQIRLPKGSSLGYRPNPITSNN